jgi:hypothetical protein
MQRGLHRRIRCELREPMRIQQSQRRRRLDLRQVSRTQLHRRRPKIVLELRHLTRPNKNARDPGCSRRLGGM